MAEDRLKETSEFYQPNAWLDCCRALAIVLVVISHARHFLTDFVPSAQFCKFGGFLGVELFFVLSGFLIGRILLQMPETNPFEWIKIFYLRRWLRTLPNYYLFLVINILLSKFLIRKASEFDLWQYLTFTQNFLTPSPHFYSEAWSLSLEEIFYTLFPLTIVAMSKFMKINIKTSLFMLALLIIWLSTFFRIIYATAYPTLVWDECVRKVAVLRFDGIILGVLLSYLWEKKSRLLKGSALIYALVGLFIGTGFYVGIQPLEQLNESWFAKTILFNLTSLGCAGVLMLGINRNFSYFFERICRLIAHLSYSAYLVNLPIKYLLAAINQFYVIHPVFNWILFMSLVFVISYLVYHLYEKKFLAFRETKYRRRKIQSLVTIQ